VEKRIMNRPANLEKLAPLLLGCLAEALACAVLIHFGGVSALAAGMGGRLPWYTTRAAAISAYIMLSITMLLGLSITAKGPNRPFNRAEVFALHEHYSWLAWGFIGLHVGSLLIDRFQPFTLAEILVPLASPYRTLEVGLGVISFYLIALLVTSFYVRTYLGRRAWRAIHFSSLLPYVLATVHGITAGSSSGLPWMQALYVLSGATVLAMLAIRIRGRSMGHACTEAHLAAIPSISTSILRRSPS
jgi:sulfoxide reductase heme-binding subunit YedZ